MRCITYFAVLCGGLLLFCGAPVGCAYGQSLRGSQSSVVPAPTETVISGSWVVQPGADGVAPPRMVPITGATALEGVPASQLPPTLVGRPVVGQQVVSPQVVSPQVVGPAVVSPAGRQVTAYRVYPSAGVQTWRPVTSPPAPVAARPTRPVYMGRGLIGQPKLYVEGQPLRNALRFLTP